MSETVTKDDFRALLELQQCDTKVDQLRHRRDHLPAHGELAAIQQEAAQLRPRVEAADSAKNQMLARQGEIEAEVEAIEARIAVINSRLYDGSANLAPSDAIAMSQEVTHLKERRLALEDRELEIMEALEPAEAEAAEVGEAAQNLAHRANGVQKVISEGQVEIDAELSDLQVSRDSLVNKVPAELLAHYESLRVRLGGEAVAALTANSCGGCHLVMSASELDAIRKAPEAEIIHCEECGRILVR